MPNERARRAATIRRAASALVLLALAIAWLARERTSPPRMPGERAGADEHVDLAAPTHGQSANQSDASQLASAADSAPQRATPPSSTTPSPSLEDPARAARIASVSGRVVDAEAKPIPGVLVLARFASELDRDVPLWRRRLPLDVADPAALGVEAPRRAVTDELGRFSLDDCEPGRFRLALRADRLAPRDFDDLVLPSGGPLAIGDLELEPGVVYSGWVLDPNGRPIAGARIACTDDFSDPTAPDLSAAVLPLVALTDARGAFRARSLGLGRARLMVRAPPDLHLPELRADVSSATSGEVGDLSLVLAQSDVVAGRVLSRPGDRGVVRAAAVAASIDPSPITAACRADYRTCALRLDGTFALDGLAYGRACELRAISPSQRFDDFSPWSLPTLAAPGQELEALLQYRADCNLSFEVVDARTRARVAESTASLAFATHVDSDADDPHVPGVIRFTGVRPTREDARATLSIEGNGFRRTLHEELLQPGLDIDVGPIAVELLPVVEVRVRAGNRPIDGALVTSTERDADSAEKNVVGSARTGADGVARLALSSSKNARLVARARGFAPATIAAPAHPAAGAAIAIDLVRGTRALVRVIDESGAPVAGVRVEHAASEWTPNDRSFGDGFDAPEDVARITSATGRCAFADLAPGRHTFRVARRESWLEGEWKIAALDGEPERDIVLVARAPASLEGFVGEGRRPLAGVRVAIVPWSSLDVRAPFLDADRALPDCATTVTDSRGRYEVRNLEPGAYACVLAIDGQELRIVRDARTLESGARRLDVDVAGSIEGSVSEPDGSPAAGALVSVLARETVERYPFGRKQRARAEEVAALAPYLKSYPFDPDHPAVRADDQGRFKIRGIQLSGAYALVASSAPDTFGARELTNTRRARDERNLSITLESRGSLRVAASSRRAGEALVLVALHESDVRVRRMRPGLELVLPALALGTWRVSLVEELGPNRFAPVGESRDVDIAAGAEETLEFALP